MAILHVANLGHPVLRMVASPVDDQEIDRPSFQAFLDDLMESMCFHKGVGLAAPQVFNAKRVVAVAVPAELDEEKKGIGPTVFINPKLTPEGKRKENGWEGCLSLKDLRGIVARFHAVRLTAQDRDGQPVKMQLMGFSARVLQHEVDHLDGIVFLDRMDNLSSLGFSKEIQMFGEHEGPDDVQAG